MSVGLNTSNNNNNNQMVWTLLTIGFEGKNERPLDGI